MSNSPTVPILPAALDEARTLAAEARQVHRELLAGAEVTSHALVVEREPFVLTLTDRIERLCAALGVREPQPPNAASAPEADDIRKLADLVCDASVVALHRGEREPTATLSEAGRQWVSAGLLLLAEQRDREEP